MTGDLTMRLTRNDDDTVTLTLDGPAGHMASPRIPVHGDPARDAAADEWRQILDASKPYLA